MGAITEAEIRSYVEKHIQAFHKRRLESLQKLSFGNILRRKNPYLFRAKNIVTPEPLVRNLLDAHLSSQEEGVFGDFLEGLAIFVCGKVYGGHKSAAEGIDLEFETDGVKYIVDIKSGPNWGNSGQIARMRDSFKKAKKILRTSNAKMRIEPVNGCCYGRDERPDKGDYLKYCGQRFWHFVSGNENLYVDIVKPLGYRAKQKNDRFMREYAMAVTRFTRSFIEDYCDEKGSICWGAILKMNSGADSLT
ncbi:MAG: PmeII family type II restriction endonuclease [Planctomycetota bacterium]